jgi:hypothetical protein
MDFLRDLFTRPPHSPEHKREVDELLNELYRIGKTDGYLSERPGAPFNFQCRHNRGRQIGKRLHDIGGLPLMEYAHKKVRRRSANRRQPTWNTVGPKLAAGYLNIEVQLNHKTGCTHFYWTTIYFSRAASNICVVNT